MRLIDADALIAKAYIMQEPNGFIHSVVTERQIAKAPTIDAVPVVHGRWESHPQQYGFERCSVCHDCNIWGEWADGKKWHYCPHCGARMDGDTDG